MTSRERVLASLNHVEPDRVPLFAPNIINTREPYDAGLRRFLDSFDFDTFVHLGGIHNRPDTQRELPDGTLEDGYGCRFRYMGVGLPYCIHSPLADARTVADVEAFDWPDPEAPGLIDPDLRERARRARDGRDGVITLNVAPIFHQYHYLRGFEQWMMDVRLNRAVHQAIAERIYHVNATLLSRLLEEVGETVDMVAGADDFGHSTAPYMAPEDFRTLVKPYYARLIGRVKTLCPHVKFYLHSHGQIMPLVGDLVDCGVDILNPVLPLDHMDPVRLKQEFGDVLCFHGGIDIERIVPFGTREEVCEHVKEVIDVLAPGGGYWLKLQAISPVVPAGNVTAAYELAREYGSYERR